MLKHLINSKNCKQNPKQAKNIRSFEKFVTKYGDVIISLFFYK